MTDPEKRKFFSKLTDLTAVLVQKLQNVNSVFCKVYMTSLINYDAVQRLTLLNVQQI